MDDEITGEHESQRAKKRRDDRIAGGEVPEEEVHPNPGQPEVKGYKQHHPCVGDLGCQNEVDQIDRIEEARLNVSRKRGTAVQVGIPKRDHPAFERLSRKVVGGIQESS